MTLLSNTIKLFSDNPSNEDTLGFKGMIEPWLILTKGQATEEGET